MAAQTHGIRTAVRSRAALVSVLSLVATCIYGVAFASSSSAGPAVGITGYQVVTGASTPIDDGAAGSATVSCPTGQTAVSAGVVSHSPLTFITNLQPVDAQTWQIGVTNTGQLGYTEHFQPYVVCVDTSSIPGMHVAQYTPASPSSGFGIYDAYCAPTDYVLGGGVSQSNTNSYLSISRPNDYRSWQIGVYNAGDPETFTTYAVCIPQADVTSYSQNTSSYASYGTFLDQPVTGSDTALSNTASAPYCDQGQVAVGGGAANHDTNNGYVSSTYPSNDNRSWLETSTDVNPPTGYTEFALPNDVCVNGTLAPIPTTTTLTLNPPNPGINQQVTLTATVSPQSGSGTPPGTVTFYDNGNSLGTATLSGGVATLSTSFGGGPHSLTASYSGDGTYAPSSTSTAILIADACTSTITGTHGSITVASGTTCVEGATINGGISVAKGATLDLENATVKGSISAGSPAGLRICGSHTGSITVSGATGLVRIGDPSSNCPANTVAGSILAANNKAGLIIVDNTVSGSVTAVGNTGSPVIVSGNHH